MPWTKARLNTGTKHITRSKDTRVRAELGKLTSAPRFYRSKALACCRDDVLLTAGSPYLIRIDDLCLDGFRYEPVGFSSSVKPTLRNGRKFRTRQKKKITGIWQKFFDVYSNHTIIKFDLRRAPGIVCLCYQPSPAPSCQMDAAPGGNTNPSLSVPSPSE